MNHKMIILAAALAAASATAHASESATLEVTGTVTPPPCSLSLSGGGKADFGSLSAESLSGDKATKLDSQSLTLTVTCPSLMAHTISVVDNAADSVDSAAAAAAKTGTQATGAYGLGKSGTNNIGAYVISLSEGLSDSKKASFITSKDNGATWTPTDLLNPGDTVRTAWKTTDNVPSSARSSTATLTIDAAIAATSSLEIGSGVTLQGSATIEVYTL